MELEKLEKAMRSDLNELFEANKEVERVYKTIRNGVATYEDAHKFALELGKMLRRSLEGMVDNVPEGFDYSEVAETIVQRALDQNYRLTSLVCETVQDELNSMSGLGLKAVAPGINQERIDAVKTALLEADGADAAKVALGEDVVTFSQAVVDDWVKTNADFQKQSGLEPIIVRKWSGRTPSHDTRHTDWCQSLAGTWVYGEHPSRVFARHQGCQCTVMYYPNKEAQGRITALAKGEKDVDEVLWNTGQVFSNSRNAVLRRRRQMYGKEEARKILNEEWKGGRNGQSERHF